MKLCLLQRIAGAVVALIFTISVPQYAEAEVLNDLGKAIENTGKGFKATGKAIGKGVEKTGDAIEKGVKSTGDAISGNKASGEAADSQPVDGKVPTPQQKPVQTTYLFVQRAGTLVYADGKLTLGDLAPSTLFFTDQPVRKAGFTTPEAIADLRNGKSAESLKTDPPKAAIAIAGHEAPDPLVVELLSAELNGNNVTYTVSVVSGELPAEATDIALFVNLMIEYEAGTGSK